MIEEFYPEEQPAAYEPPEITPEQYEDTVQALKEVSKAGFDQPLHQNDVMHLSNHARDLLLIVGKVAFATMDATKEHEPNVITSNPVYRIEKPLSDGCGIVELIVQPRIQSIVISRQKLDGGGNDYLLTIEAPIPYGPDVNKRIFAVDYTTPMRQSFYPQQNADSETLMGYFSIFKTAIKDVLEITSVPK